MSDTGGMAGPAGEDVESARLRRISDAMAHPLRGRLLFALTEKPGVTIRQLSARTSETTRRVRYHLEKMIDDGIVRVEQESIQAATIERRYRAAEAPVIETDEVGRMSVDQRRRIALEILKAVFADARAAITAGTFCTQEGHCEVRWWAEVDQEGWEELARIHDQVYGELSAAIAKIKARVEAGGEPTMAITSALFLFEAPPW